MHLRSGKVLCVAPKIAKRRRAPAPAPSTPAEWLAARRVSPGDYRALLLSVSPERRAFYARAPIATWRELFREACGPDCAPPEQRRWLTAAEAAPLCRAWGDEWRRARVACCYVGDAWNLRRATHHHACVCYVYGAVYDDEPHPEPHTVAKLIEGLAKRADRSHLFADTE